MSKDTPRPAPDLEAARREAAQAKLSKLSAKGSPLLDTHRWTRLTLVSQIRAGGRRVS